MNKVSYFWGDFERDCYVLANKIKEGDKRYTHVFGIARGGLIPAIRLSHLLDIPLLQEMVILPKDCLVVDDISDTGKTLEYFQEKGFDLATLFYKESSKIKPNFWARTARDWIEFPWEVN